MMVKISLTFIMTPLFLGYMGNYDYGLWEMVGAVLGYMGMLDLGIKPAISVYVSRFRARQEPANLEKVYATTGVFMAVVGALIALILVGWGLLFSEQMAPEGEQAIKYTLFMLILAGQMLIVFPGYVAESFLEGFQKYYLKNNITIVNSLIGAGVFIYYATPENALLLLAAVNAVGLVSKYLIFMFLLTRPTQGPIVFRWSRFTPGMLKEMLQFSLKSFVQGLATRIDSFTDTLVIGTFLGPAVVPLYSIPQNLVLYIQTMGWTLSHAFLPLFSDLAERSQQESIRRIYLVASKVVVGLVLAMGIGVVILATPFLEIWIGPEYTAQSDKIVLLLVVFTLLPLLNPFSSRYLTAINRHGIFARWMPVAAIANLALSMLFVGPYGIIGVAVASVIPAVILQPMLLVYTCRQLEVPVARYIAESLVPLLLPLLLMGVFVVFMRWGAGMDSYRALSVAAAGGALIYAICFWFFSLSPAERLFIAERLRSRRA